MESTTLVNLCLLIITQLFFLAQSAPFGAIGVEETSLLSGTESTTISCIVYGGVNLRSIKWLHDGQEITVDNDKYRLSPNTFSRLEIKDITSTDEGLYSCSYDLNGSTITADIVCIYVLGYAGFFSPETTTIDAFSGETVELDARVMYTGAGPSDRNQVITVLHLFKLQSRFPSLVYFCGDENSRKGTPCPFNDKVSATSGAYKYDLTLNLNNLTMEDAGRYEARIELLKPRVSSRSYIRKEFVIQVHKSIEVNVWREEKTLRCQVPLVSINEEAHLSLTWQGPSGEGLTSNENVQLRTKENQTEASLTAEFQTLSSGDYSCIATVSLTGTAGVNRTVTSVLTVLSDSDSQGNTTDNQSSAFQVTIGPVSAVECSIWYDAEKSAAMEATIRMGVAHSVSEHCNCNHLVAKDIVMGQLSCQGDWLTYRSYLHEIVEKKEKEAILTSIVDWTSSDKPTITLGLFTLQVNSQCSGRTLRIC